MIQSHKSLFEKYKDMNVITKVTQYSKWTLPQLMADMFLNIDAGQQVLERDYQEIGALLTNNLASKLAGLLFPSNRPFFKVEASENVLNAAKRKGVDDSELQAGLAKMETDSCQQLFVNGSYAQQVQLMKHLIVTGNALYYRDPKGKRTIVYGMHQYVVRRDGNGTVLDTILRESSYFDALPPEVQNALRIKHAGKYNGQNPDQRVDSYIRISRKVTDSGIVQYEATQEVDDVPVGEAGKWPAHLCPWQPVTWTLLTGEHYGRGLVEDYAGGFARLSDLSQSLALYQISAMKVLNLVRSGAGADIDELAGAESGEYVQGDPDCIQTFEGGDAKKIAEVSAQIEAVFGRLARAFMYKANTRDAERVTAEELRQDAMEAENTLGGVYSVLAESIQVPLAHILLLEVNPGSLEGIISKDLKLNIIAGIQALGRAADVQNLLLAAQEIANIVPALVSADQRIDPAKVADMIYAGRSIDTSILFKDKKQQAEEQQALQQQQQGQAQMQQSAVAADNLAQMQQLSQTQG